MYHECLFENIYQEIHQDLVGEKNVMDPYISVQHTQKLYLDACGHPMMDTVAGYYVRFTLAVAVYDTEVIFLLDMTAMFYHNLTPEVLRIIIASGYKVTIKDGNNAKDIEDLGILHHGYT